MLPSVKEIQFLFSEMSNNLKIDQSYINKNIIRLITRYILFVVNLFENINVDIIFYTNLIDQT
jgi:hypothetical protein